MGIRGRGRESKREIEGVEEREEEFKEIRTERVRGRERAGAS